MENEEVSGYEIPSGQGQKAIELTHITANVYDDYVPTVGSDEHAYDVADITAPANVSAAPAKVSTKVSTAPAKVSTAPAKVSTAPAKVSTAPAKVSTAPAKVSTAPAKVSTAPVKDSSRKSEFVLSVRMIVVAAVSVLILSTVASTIVVVVYHTTIGKIPELQTQVDMIVETQTTSSIQLNTLEATSNRKLGILELQQTDASQQLTTLDQKQANTSVLLDALTDKQTNSNSQLEILAEKQNNSGKRVAFSAYNLKPSLAADNTPIFYYTTVNTGSFNMTSGTFTCPVAGLYYFSFSFERNTDVSGLARCFFHVNGEGNVYVHARTGAHEAASASVIHQLSVNDVVRLHCEGWTHIIKSLHSSMFVGFLINQD